MNKTEIKFPTARELAKWEKTLPDKIRNGHKAVNNPRPKAKARRVGKVNTTVSHSINLEPIIINHETARNAAWYLN